MRTGSLQDSILPIWHAGACHVVLQSVVCQHAEVESQPMQNENYQCPLQIFWGNKPPWIQTLTREAGNN